MREPRDSMIANCVSKVRRLGNLPGTSPASRSDLDSSARSDFLLPDALPPLAGVRARSSCSRCCSPPSLPPVGPNGVALDALPLIDRLGESRESVSRVEIASLESEAASCTSESRHCAAFAAEDAPAAILGSIPAASAASTSSAEINLPCASSTGICRTKRLAHQKNNSLSVPVGACAAALAAAAAATEPAACTCAADQEASECTRLSAGAAAPARFKASPRSERNDSARGRPLASPPPASPVEPTDGKGKLP
mmetsp:Transcript_4706/g.12363  ORF Transcript_4706/g.12363 Transcript_4706/m.12363 type:complete len:253 (-) Transcript_4706:265-1023(-)